VRKSLTNSREIRRWFGLVDDCDRRILCYAAISVEIPLEYNGR